MGVTNHTVKLSEKRARFETMTLGRNQYVIHWV